MGQNNIDSIFYVDMHTWKLDMSYVDSDVIDSKLTCMYISIDGIRLAKLVMCSWLAMLSCMYISVEPMGDSQSFWFAQFGCRHHLLVGADMEGCMCTCGHVPYLLLDRGYCGWHANTWTLLLSVDRYTQTFPTRCYDADMYVHVVRGYGWHAHTLILLSCCSYVNSHTHTYC